VVRALAKDSAWVRNHENIFVIGLAAWARAFSPQLWHRKLVATAIRFSIFALLPCCGELALARADGSLRHFLARLSRIDVLVIDDWAWRR